MDNCSDTELVLYDGKRVSDVGANSWRNGRVGEEKYRGNTLVVAWRLIYLIHMDDICKNLNELLSNVTFDAG